MNTSNCDILNQFGGMEANSLVHKLKSLTDESDEPLDSEPSLIQLSSYFSIEDLTIALQAKKNQFTILSLNCASLNAKFDQIKILVENLKANQCMFSAICFQETWLSSQSDLSLLQLEGYNLIAQGNICSAHGGLAIYLRECFHYKTLSIYKESDIWEGLFIEVNSDKIQKKIILGNILH